MSTSPEPRRTRGCRHEGTGACRPRVSRLAADKHREQLSKALGEFFAACAAYFDAAVHWVDADYRYTASMQTEKQDENFQRHRDAEALLAKSETDARVKGFQLLVLVKNDDGLVAEVKAIAMEPIPAERKDRRAAINARRARLQALTERLGGVFVPQRPQLPEPFDPVEPENTDQPGKLLP